VTYIFLMQIYLSITLYEIKKFIYFYIDIFRFWLNNTYYNTRQKYCECFHNNDIIKVQTLYPWKMIQWDNNLDSFHSMLSPPKRWWRDNPFGISQSTLIYKTPFSSIFISFPMQLYMNMKRQNFEISHK